MILIVVTVRNVISLSSVQNIRYLRRLLFYSFYFINAVSYIHHVWLYSLAIKCSGAIEENPGLKPNSCEYFSICHWNLNSVSAHNFIKLFLLRVYISINKIETYLETNLVRTDNSTNTKRGGICIYYHNSLPFKVIDIQLLNECINFEIRIGGKLCSFLCLYRSPSQTRDIFETFADNFEKALDSIINKSPFEIVALTGIRLI